MRALVTGGAGFIGSHLVDALLARGDRVVVLDDLSTGRRRNLHAAMAAGARLVEGSVLDRELLDRLLAGVAPDVIFHLAAQVDVRRSLVDPAEDARVNVGGTVNVLEAARRNGNPLVVHSSTGGAIHGEVDPALLPAAESVPGAPLSPYGCSKLAAERRIERACSRHGQRTAILRYANVYGPRQDLLGEGGVVAIFCGRLLRGQRPTIFGDGNQTRDFVHVGDVVAANLLAVDHGSCGPLNISTGRETSINELAAALAEHASWQFTPRYSPARAGEVERNALSNRLARATLGWRPRVALPDGLADTLAQLRSPTPSRRATLV